MSVKHYGIYIAYAPTVDLRAEGLGRHLAMFLKGAEVLKDIRFTIVCPSWTRDALESLFQSEQVSTDVFDIVSPVGKPYALRMHEALQTLRRKRKIRGWLPRVVDGFKTRFARFWQNIASRVVAVHSFWGLMGFLLLVGLMLLFLTPLALLALPIGGVYVLVRLMRVARKIPRLLFRGSFAAQLRKLAALLASPQQEPWVLRLFDAMNKHEASRMREKIDGLVAIRAWYCPTAFWPEFNNIKAPRLMCVPDVVLSSFPAGFATLAVDRTLRAFEDVMQAIRAGENFVTYSADVKWRTLVDECGIPADRVSVIPHAPNGLERYVSIRGFPDVEATSRHYCQALLLNAMTRSSNPSYTGGFLNRDIKFLFYASQFRPNKNVMMLLRAYEFLLRKRFVGHKLILTGRPGAMPEIERFVIDHRLENDVLFLHGLSLAELAACYKLADLAVNPSLSEGGCPFTFTEALSVGTPVLMSRIAVAEEVLAAPNLQELTFFDPFDWRDCAKRIEWALNNRSELLSTQLEAYAQLCQRTWSDVVREHVQVLDRIADETPQVAS